MVQFKDCRMMETVELPSFPGSEVKMYSSVLVNELKPIIAKYSTNKEAGPDNVAMGLEKLTKAIVSWNFTSDIPDPENPGQTKEIPTPITAENLSQLPERDCFLLVDVMERKRIKNENGEWIKVSEDEKKSVI